MVAIGATGAVVIGGLTGLWWWWGSRGGRAEPPRPVKAEEFTKPVAVVDKLCIKSGHEVEMEETECTRRGLKHDR